MAKDKLTEYSATNASNDVIGDISVAEGMLPSAVNNALREQMTHLKNFADGTDGINVLSLDDDDASASIKIQAPSAVTTTTTLTLPDGDGDAGAMLQTDGSGQLAWSTAYRNSNLVLNGSMQVAQRGTSTASVTSGGYYTCDRFALFGSSFGAYTVSQSSTSPDGFANSLKLDCTTADTNVEASDHFGVQTKFEGQDLQQLQKGTSGAKSVVASFFVRSNKTGTYTLELDDRDNTRSFSKTYTIDSANTWEHKTVTFAGDTTGVLDNDNAGSLFLTWWLMAGSTFNGGTFSTGWASRTNANRVSSSNINLSDSTDNEWYITGVQLEIGEQATPFEHRSYGDELAACQRYYTEIQKASGQVISTTTSILCGVFPTEMRTTPSASLSGALTIWQLGIAGSKAQSSSNISVSSTINSASVFNAECANFTGMTLHTATAVAGGDQPLKFDAEL